MTAIQKQLKFDTLRSINSATFTGSYQAIGTGMTHNPVIIKITNDSTVGVIISDDGLTDGDYIPSGGFVLYDISTNESLAPGRSWPLGTIFYVKAAAGVGLVYLTVLYARG